MSFSDPKVLGTWHRASPRENTARTWDLGAARVPALQVLALDGARREEYRHVPHGESDGPVPSRKQVRARSFSSSSQGLEKGQYII